jgi:hypothetical protein
MRDYIAIQAMAAFLSSPKGDDILIASGKLKRLEDGTTNADRVTAWLSYVYADALIAESEKKKP